MSSVSPSKTPPKGHRRINNRARKALREYDLKTFEECIQSPHLDWTYVNELDRTFADDFLYYASVIFALRKEAYSAYDKASLEAIERIFQVLQAKQAPLYDKRILLHLREQPDVAKMAFTLGVSEEQWGTALCEKLNQPWAEWLYANKPEHFSFPPQGKEKELWDKIFQEKERHLSMFKTRFSWDLNAEQAEVWFQRMMACTQSHRPLFHYCKMDNMEGVKDCLNRGYPVLGDDEQPSVFATWLTKNRNGFNLDDLSLLFNGALQDIQKRKLQETDIAKKWIKESLHALIQVLGDGKNLDDKEGPSEKTLQQRQKMAGHFILKMAKVMDPVQPVGNKDYRFERPVPTFLRSISIREPSEEFIQRGLLVLEKIPSLMQELHQSDNVSMHWASVLEEAISDYKPKAMPDVVLKWALRHHANLNERFEESMWRHGVLKSSSCNQPIPCSPLLMHIASRNKFVNYPAFQQLVQAGADITVSNTSGLTLIDVFLEQEKEGSPQALQAVLEADTAGFFDKMDVARRVIQAGQVSHLKILIDMGIVPLPEGEDRDVLIQTMLEHATKNKEALRVILDKHLLESNLNASPGLKASKRI